MTVEVGQMVVKSNVSDRQEAEQEGYVSELEASREAILDECRRLIQEALRDVKER
jgi:hypothetical protein